MIAMLNVGIIAILRTQNHTAGCDLGSLAFGALLCLGRNLTSAWRGGLFGAASRLDAHAPLQPLGSAKCTCAGGVGGALLTLHAAVGTSLLSVVLLSGI